jgi:hypothetical protein
MNSTPTKQARSEVRFGGFKEGNRHHASVYDEQEYVAMRRFITDDGKTARTGASCGRVRPRHAHAHQ